MRFLLGFWSASGPSFVGEPELTVPGEDFAMAFSSTIVMVMVGVGGTSPSWFVDAATICLVDLNPQFWHWRQLAGRDSRVEKLPLDLEEVEILLGTVTGILALRS
jgi:hypothetical protein